MAMLICDPGVEKRVLAERRANGQDLWDEVWDGVYFTPPFPNIEHQDIQLELAVVLRQVVTKAGLGTVYTSVNVGDRDEDWEHNFRVPDIAVFLNGNPAKERGTHWVGGPDMAVEIVSPRDRSREKLDFYASVGVRELLLIDRAPWSLELFRLAHGALGSVGTCDVSCSTPQSGMVVPLSFGLIASGVRPRIRVTHNDGAQQWAV